MSINLAPNFLEKLDNLHFRLRLKNQGKFQGKHLSNMRGQGLEFAEHRAYVPGDDFRKIDWNLLARSDKFYVKEYREEKNTSVAIIIDTSKSMNYPENACKIKATFYLSLALAYIALKNGENVKFFFPGKRSYKEFQGIKSIPKILLMLKGLTFEDEINFSEQIKRSLDQYKGIGTGFFISDFLINQEEIFAVSKLLVIKLNKLSIIQVLSGFELQPEIFEENILIDAETNQELSIDLSKTLLKEYSKSLFEFLDNLKNYCYANSIAYGMLETTQRHSKRDFKKLEEIQEEKELIEKIIHFVAKKLPELGVIG